VPIADRPVGTSGRPAPPPRGRRLRSRRRCRFWPAMAPEAESVIRVRTGPSVHSNGTGKGKRMRRERRRAMGRTWLALTGRFHWQRMRDTGMRNVGFGSAFTESETIGGADRRRLGRRSSFRRRRRSAGLSRPSAAAALRGVCCRVRGRLSLMVDGGPALHCSPEVRELSSPVRCG
jgi:hypothetical protein